MKAEVALLIMNLSCADPQMTLREFYSRYFVPPTTDTGSFRWGYRGMSMDSVYQLQLDGIGDYAEYRIARAETCGGHR